ncbi:hypothetical protein KDA08_06070, partial [Candidatus Saccharibacteria bacterium]|nr:hypothetical protein [Candidatus Saccharibacteria bacterium]
MSQTIDGYGSAITSTNVGGAVTSGGKQGLDVAIISGSVTITGTITTDDLIHTDDSVRLGDGTDLLSFGQQLMSASLPVVIASDQSVISVSGTISANQSGTWNINNISGTISLPTGAATETTLSTLNTKIPSNLTVTSTRLLVDGSSVTQPVSGSVTVSGTVAATQSGTWNIASITTGVVAGTNANNLGKAEDARHSDGDTGVFMLGVRQDTLASSVNADSDYAGIKLNSLGAIYVEPRQKTHDNLNLNANLQINNTDVSSSNGL